MSSNLVTITGPSGSGKTELIKALENRGKFARLISVTTRPMRPGEIDGLDYYFITEAEYQTIVSAGGFLQTVDFNGYHYGTTTHELARVRSIEKTPIVIVEPSGITQFDRISKEHGNMKFWWNAIFVDSVSPLIRNACDIMLAAFLLSLRN
jgi:guanylate kinase